MARKKLKNKNTRKISRMGGYSLGITFPMEIVKKLKWREKQKVVVKLYGKDKILISDWQPK